MLHPRQSSASQSAQQDWWTTSNGSVFLPSGTDQGSTKSSIPSASSSSPITPIPSSAASSSPSSATPPSSSLSSGLILTTYTTTFPTTVTQPTTTFTSLAESVVTGALATTTFSPGRIDSNASPVCIGSGLDSSTNGLLASIIIPSFIGLLIWLVFAILRPRFRQIYGLREWFVEQDLRPKPLSSSLFAFLHPPVPFVPSVPSDVSDMGRSPAEDAELFPADEQLSQRAIWIALLIALGWALLGLAGALPLYMVSLPCIADQPSSSTLGGMSSTLEDLSLMRLLRALDSGSANHLRVRIIVLTVLVLIIKELNRLIAYRRRWLDLRCEGKQMGWLSVRDAPGFVGWGEKRFKDFVIKSGLSSGMNNSGNGKNGSRHRNGNRNGTSSSPDDQPNQAEKDALQVDIQKLEIAETRYISSFRLTTPDPSIADYQPPTPKDPNRPYISHPQPLRVASTRKPRQKRSLNPAFAASSLAPTSFVAPSLYYKLHRVQGVSGGQFGGEGAVTASGEEPPSLSQTINSRVIGSRFQEVNRNSLAYGRLPLGSHVRVDESGELGPTDETGDDEHGWLPIPNPRRFGPNHGLESSSEMDSEKEEADWVDIWKERPGTEDSVDNERPGPSSPFKRSMRQRPSPREEPEQPSTSTKRETFPFRRRLTGTTDAGGEAGVPPPHMRLQPTQPFVRPHDGIDFAHLGVRGYGDIADGVRIKGWLMIGRGLRHVRGMQLIEGMAKEDIRWDVLQNERGTLDTIVLWCLVGVAAILLAAGLTAAAGLSLTTAPDVAHYLPFLSPLLSSTDTVGAGVATVLAPAVAATLFIALAVAVVNWSSHIKGSVSVSGTQLFVFRAMFYILVAIGAIWLITVGALVYTLQAFNADSDSTLQQSQSVANGAIYMSILALSLIFTVAIVFPGLLLLQPIRLWHVLRAEKRALTPRQRFRAVYPRTYNPAYATGACILAIIFASTFSLIFPLIAPAVVILLFLTLVAHRFLVGYVYARTHSQTGGLLQIWLLRRFGTLLAFQPILLGLIFLSRNFWIEGGVLCGAGLFVILFVEVYVSRNTRLPGRGSLSPITRDSLSAFSAAARPARRRNVDEESTSLVSSARPGHRPRGSMASVLEMMSLTLAVMPSPSPVRGPVPLTRSANASGCAPHLPPLAFTDHAQEMASILYAPELIAPPPIIWLPNDSAGVARSEAVDLQKYHDLQVTLDVRSKHDVAQHGRASTSRS
ncbi:hypothetical protein B0H10DRAFT_2163535 [Mycena sp. CBHHK59/15]|nr:hypothetical protein B0H10DRAFT_2163535 [Mycena sp. CBHHK59/15]